MITEHHIPVSRTARYWTIGGGPAGTSGGTDGIHEIWVACHGYGQLAAALLTDLEPIVAPGCLIVAPEGLSRFYLDPPGGDPAARRVGASWMTREDREHEIADQVAYLDALVELLPVESGQSRVRLRLLGFSQGVATVARWVARGHVRADELVLWAGGFPPDIDLTAVRDRFATTTVTLVLGTRDRYVAVADAEALVGRFDRAGIPARLRTFEGGHRLDADTLRAIAREPALPNVS